ncbi:MAG: EamA family transporter [Bacteroidota bacterium]
MPTWIIYALIATLFAGVTSVFVKSGIRDINAELGLVIRIGIVFFVSIVNLFVMDAHKGQIQLSNRTLFYLIISGLTTSVCWIFYYKAIDIGNVSMISAIDKGSIVITILMAVTFLGEPFTLKLALGTGLILMGMVVLVWQ